MYQILAYSKNFVFWTKFKRVFLQKKRKIKHYHWILNILINLCIKFQIKLTIFTFCIKFYPKRLFLVENRKVNIDIEFCIFKSVQVLNFTLTKQFWILGTNLLKKGISSQKGQKWSSPLNSAYSNWSGLQLSD